MESVHIEETETLNKLLGKPGKEIKLISTRTTNRNFFAVQFRIRFRIAITSKKFYKKRKPTKVKANGQVVVAGGNRQTDKAHTQTHRWSLLCVRIQRRE